MSDVAVLGGSRCQSNRARDVAHDTRWLSANANGNSAS
jgi:hypothetical protein